MMSSIAPISLMKPRTMQCAPKFQGFAKDRKALEVMQVLNQELGRQGLPLSANSIGFADGKGPLLTIQVESSQERSKVMEVLKNSAGWSSQPVRPLLLFDCLVPVGLIQGIEIALFEMEKYEQYKQQRDLDP